MKLIESILLMHSAGSYVCRFLSSYYMRILHYSELYDTVQLRTVFTICKGASLGLVSIIEEIKFYQTFLYL